MGIVELFLVGVALAMDAFAASICQGLGMVKIDLKKALFIALMFGAFQALMPLIGYLIAGTFASYITNIDHWIAFILLVLLGINLIKEAFEKEEKVKEKNFFMAVFLLALATSIDAMAIGVTFAFLRVDILLAVLIIGLVTFVISLIGIYIGRLFGSRYKSVAEIFGGVVLILIGLRILLEHLGIL